MDYSIITMKQGGLPSYPVTLGVCVMVAGTNLDALIGAPGGLATLDANGRVETAQLGAAWQPVHEYPVEAELRLGDSVTQFIRCISSGISGDTVPDFAAYPFGGVINDGGVVWQKLRLAVEV